MAVVALGGTPVWAAQKRGSGARRSSGTRGLRSRRAGDAGVAAHDKASSFLGSTLASPNEYLRKLALEHLLEACGPVASPVIAAVIPRLAETTSLPSAWCAEMYDRQQAGIKKTAEGVVASLGSAGLGPASQVLPALAATPVGVSPLSRGTACAPRSRSP